MRQKWALGLSVRRIARSVGLSRPSVSSYLRRAEGCGLSWPLPAELDEAELERRLFPPLPPSSVARTEPDWVEVHRELKGKGVTLELLWDEYKAANPDGYQYSTFCQYYRRWCNRLDVVMRHDHRAGEKLFVACAVENLRGTTHHFWQCFIDDYGTMRHSIVNNCTTYPPMYHFECSIWFYGPSS